LDGLNVITLEPDMPGVATRAFLKLRREFGITPDLSKLRAIKPNLVHAHFGMDAVEAFPIARALNVPMIVTLHGFDINIHKKWWESGKGGLFMRRYPRRLTRLGANAHVSFIAVSDAIKQQAIAYGIPEEKITVIYIGVDVPAFNRGPLPICARTRRVLFVGRLVEKKGCEFLLRAMRVVNERVGGSEVTIVGDGPQRPALEALARQLGVKANFRGLLSSIEVKNELDAARVFCLPSITAVNGDAEGLGIVLLEAQAKGVPVITSAGGRKAEGVVDGETGFAFAERDTNALIEALIRLLSDDQLAESMGAAGPIFIRRRFDIRDCTRKLESYYDEVVDKQIGY
jgi:glycosyltransferase involved in cell wall biosynthesis